MKTILQITTLILLGLIPTRSEAQTQMTICAGSSAVVTASNSLGLTSATYSMNPGALTSSNGVFTVTPSSTTVYSLYVTGFNSSSQLVTSSSTTTVQVEGVTYTIVSPQNFTLGCATKSVCSIMIMNANTYPIGGGPVTYTILPPGSSSNIPTGTLSTINQTNVIIPGPWTVIVRSNFNSCTDWDTVNVVMNNGAPQIGTVTNSQFILDCNNSTTTLQAVNNTNYQYTWLPVLVTGNNLIVQSNTAAPTSSVTQIFTLVATDINNACQSTTSVPVYQSLHPPTAQISGLIPVPCSNTIMLTNTSKSNIPFGSIFPTGMPCVGLLWEGPTPQQSLAVSSTYVASGLGIYTLTAKDLNNGCTSQTTKNIFIIIPQPSAAFAHTVTTGTAVFNDLSTGTESTTAYFWNFGDGNTSTLQNPTHNYVSSGAHLVKLKVMNFGFGCKDSVIQSINVSGIPCSANSGFSMAPTSTPQVWNVTPAYPWNVTAASWDWGDNSSSNTLYTSHQYSAAGMYNICLTVTVSCVATSSTCTSYSVYRTSQPQLIISINVVSPELISGMLQPDDLKQLSWNITPNPNSGEFKLNLENSGTKSARVVINDLMGRKVFETTVDNNSSVPVNVSDLPSGMYIVTLEADGLRTTKRLVVDH